MNFYIESLGCARNQVDSEVMTGRLVKAGFSLTMDPSLANLIIVNTCSFIEAAVNESVDTILELSQFKKDGLCKKMIVVGCLPERFREEIIEAFPEVDWFLGTGAFDKILYIAQNSLNSRGCTLPNPDGVLFSDSTVRKLKSPYVAYLKIAEGCSANCTYCIIPKLRGRHKSKPMSQILFEAEKLISSGVREITLVAQDTTAYGRDLSNGEKLDELLAELATLSREVWIRFLYGHPETITEAVIDKVALYGNLCPYFDLPVQHVSASILKSMGRSYDKEFLFSLFNNIRDRVHGAILRTTLMVGFPGETEVEFMELVEFLDKVRFDNLGVFIYSDSLDLPAHVLSNHVDEETAIFRRNKLLSKQLKISRSNLHNFIGQTIEVLIESVSESDLYEGRSMLQAPEVDGITYLRANRGAKLDLGSVKPVRILDSLEYDLIGEVYDRFKESDSCIR